MKTTDRLTEHNSLGQGIINMQGINDELEARERIKVYSSLIIAKLTAYEDTCLSPEEVNSLKVECEDKERAYTEEHSLRKKLKSESNDWKQRAESKERQLNELTVSSCSALHKKDRDYAMILSDNIELRLRLDESNRTANIEGEILDIFRKEFNKLLSISRQDFKTKCYFPDKRAESSKSECFMVDLVIKLLTRVETLLEQEELKIKNKADDVRKETAREILKKETIRLERMLEKASNWDKHMHTNGGKERITAEAQENLIVGLLDALKEIAAEYGVEVEK